MLTFFRIIKTGFQNFLRTLSVAQASIWVITFSLILLTGLFMASRLLERVIQNVKERVDLTIYLKKESDENAIFKLRDNLQVLPNVKKVIYISRSEALEIFKEEHKNNPIILESLAELEENPLLASLNVKVDDLAMLAQITDFVNANYKNLVSKINFFENQELIEKISAFTNSLKRGGLIITLILAIIVVLVNFNTIRLSIYALREEIQIMRLVGASNSFIRGPFIVEAMIYGLIGALIAFFLLFLSLKILSTKYTLIFLEFNFYEELANNFWFYLGFQIIIALILSTVSTLIAMNRYLKF